MTTWQYLAVAGMGAYHGADPAMGWLVALAAGVRERCRTALLKALLPIAAGHALSVFVAAFLISVLRSVAATQTVAIGGGGALVAFGLWHAFSHHHAAVGFRLSRSQLTGWSFLMSSVHGAGLALVPILVTATPGVPVLDATDHSAHVHSGVGGQAGSLWVGLTATAIHTVSMVAVAGVIALVAFQLAAIPMSRTKRWRLLDRVWALALIASGTLTVALALAT